MHEFQARQVFTDADFFCPRSEKLRKIASLVTHSSIIHRTAHTSSSNQQYPMDDID